MVTVFSYLGWVLSLALGVYLFKTKSDLTKESTEKELLAKQSEALNLENTNLKSNLEKFNNDATVLREKNAALNATNESYSKSKTATDDAHKRTLGEFDDKLEKIRCEKNELARKVTVFEESEAQRVLAYDQRANRLDTVFKQREEEREKEKQAKELAESNRLQILKETWSRHETGVEEKIRAICQKQGIEYVDKETFPHKGKPDNSVKICGEFVVFDSKSPQGEDLSNFPTYIKREAEAAKKYAKIDDVKKDIFLVVPTNAIHVIEDTYKVYGDYRVYVITEDSLTPVLMCLQKIEDYEFADKLSPEGREKIVSILGKMAHGMKRRIQVDQFFANEYISVLTDAENLPPDILAEAQAVERSSKLNPPLERRTKIIDNESLLKQANKVAGKAKTQEIDMDANLSLIESLPLHIADKE